MTGYLRRLMAMTSPLNPQMVSTLAAIATVQCVAEAYQNSQALPDLRNTLGIIGDSEGLEEVRRYHLDQTIAWGEELFLEAAAIHATTSHPSAKTVIYVMMKRLETSIDELRALRSKADDQD